MGNFFFFLGVSFVLAIVYIFVLFVSRGTIFSGLFFCVFGGGSGRYRINGVRLIYNSTMSRVWVFRSLFGLSDSGRRLLTILRYKYSFRRYY